MAKPEPLKAEDLSWRCDPAAFPFDTTDGIPPIEEIIGQERALRAIDFGLGITDHNYNIYVLGASGTGKTTAVRAILEARAAGEPVPDDWCYVYNFSEPDRPNAISLPPGRGCELVEEMESLVGALRVDIPKVFESKDYEKHRDEIIEGQQELTKEIFAKLERTASEMGISLKKTASGLAVAPSMDGKPLSQEDYEKLSREERKKVDENLKIMQDRLSDAVREARNLEKETRRRIAALDREVVQYVVNPLISEMLDKFKDIECVVGYLEQVREDILANIDDFRPGEELQMPVLAGMKLQRPEPTFERYKVNLIVNNRETRGVPVVFETNPTYYNLFGRIEYRVQFGVGTTDFTMIVGGAVHKANGGYLVVNAIDVLRNIFVYDSLKRMIKNREVKIEDVWEQYRLVSTTTLKPEPIPVNLKLVLIGEPIIYYLLYNLDPEYRKLMKVKADFDVVMPRNEENIHKYGAFIAARCKEQCLVPIDRTGVARIVEQSARLAGDKEKLSSRFNEIENLVVETSYWARAEGAAAATAEHVERAIEEKRYRVSKIEDKIREYITDDTIMVATEGAVVGQINGLAVLDPGDYAFGKPSRVTARTFMGDSGVVNIEREAKLSGKIHNKALFILTSFLGERYAQEFPLTLSATITFEQLYDEIEGDSATLTEVYALLSNLSGLPINQGLAITGSMNQRGEVQPIGGVNEKIEGFFDVCKARGLTGTQGVIIPRRNVRNLMLKREVREAVAEGTFSIYAIDHVDEGFELLTGTTMGEKGPDGRYPEGTANRLIHDRLKKLATAYKAFGRPKPAQKKTGAENDNNGPGKPARG